MRAAKLLRPLVGLGVFAILAMGLALSLTDIATALRSHGSVASPKTLVAPSDSVTSGSPSSVSSYQLIVEPETGMTRLYSLLASANSSIDMVMYELTDSTIEETLASAVSRHVIVRVLLDSAYVGKKENLTAYRYLSTHGVTVRWAPTSTIFHEKAFTVDGVVAAIGTGNFTPQYYASSRDFWLVDSDPTDVAAVDQTFTSDWAGGAPSDEAPGTDLLWSPGSGSRMVALIASAQHSVYFESEELSAPAVVNALVADAKRGVVCDVLMEDTADWKTAFATLARSGCHIRTYPESGSLYIHAKAVLVDAGSPDAQLFLGSENASVSSLTYNRELGVVLTDPQAPAVLKTVGSVFKSDFEHGFVWT